MSLRNDQRASRKVSRATRRNTTALNKACESVIRPDTRQWEPLENRVLMALVHHYMFDEASGADVTDALGTNNGTLVNEATGTDPGVERLTASPSPAGGGYLNFDAAPGANAGAPSFGSTGGRVDLLKSLTANPGTLGEGNAAPDLSNNGSVVAYMRITPVAGEYIGNDTAWQAPGITGNEQAGGGNDIFYGSVGLNGTVGMQRGDGAIARSRPIADGTWHQVAVTRTEAGVQSVYIDGRLHSTVNGAGGAVTSFFNSLGAVQDVAADGVTNQGGYNYLNNTDLDDVRIYNHALTAAEINALLPGGAVPAAPTNGTTAVDPANGSRITVGFTDNATNEAGFILERSINGGAFAEVAQPGSSAASGGVITITDIAPAFNQSIVYRVRAFNTAGASANLVFAPVTSGPTAPGQVSAGYMNSNFWGVTNRDWVADNDPTDGATQGGGANDVGELTLNGTNRDPSSPSGLVIRNPDVIVLDPLTQFGTLSRDWGTGVPHPAIRADNHTTIYTGKATIPADADGDGNLNETGVVVQFQVNGDDDTHGYVNGVLISTDPGGHGRQDALNTHPGITVNEGQKVDFVLLQAEQGGGSATGMKWILPDGTNEFIPVAALEAGPSVPQASTLIPAGVATAHQVSFTIDDDTTSEQRFELYRKLATQPDSAYQKVNEAGINSPFINDASANPGTAYTYVLRGFNFASGLGVASAPVTVTTAAADPAAAPGLQAYYFNDEFWGQGLDLSTPGVPRPLPRHDLQGRMSSVYVGFGETINSADVHEFAPVADDAHTVQRPSPGTPVISFDYGGDQHDYAVRPGGSPDVQIRDNNHSTVFTGQLVVTEPGEYKILGFGDDDTYVVVDGVLVSSDPFGHGIRDPRPSATNNGVADRADRFVRPVTLTAGEHNIAVLHSEGGGGSGVRLQWIRPGQTAVELVPATALNTRTPVPSAGTPTTSAADARGTNVLMNFGRPEAGRSELKTVVEIATDAAFTTGYRKVVVGAGSESFRLFGLTPNTTYFARATFLNFEGQSTSAVGTFNSGSDQIPETPTNLSGRAISPTQVRLNWVDNAFDETSYIVQRRLQGGTFADIATLPANTTTFLDTLDPVAFPAGTMIEYQVFSANASGRSNPGSNVLLVNVGFPGGTGLRRRIWDDVQLAANPDDIITAGAAQQLAQIGEPSLDSEGNPTAPLIDEVDPQADDGYGDQAPAPGVGADTFAIEWVGQIYAEETKGYEFSIVGDDGVRLFINDVLVIDGAWVLQGDTEYFSEPIALTAGQKYNVRFQMYENGGGATGRLRWNGIGGVREAIPTSFLFPTVGPNDAVAVVPFRPVTGAKAFALPGNAASSIAPSIAVDWQDNAFGEAGYEVQRATNATFTTGVVTWGRDSSGVPIINGGRRLFVDNGTNPDGSSTPLVNTTTYFYRVRPLGAPDTAWVVAGSAKPVDVDAAAQDLTLTNFMSPNSAFTNGDATQTAEGTLRLAWNRNDEHGSAYINRSFDISRDFKVTYDQQIGSGNNADGMTFMMQNHIPLTPAGVLPTQLTAIGGGGGNMAANGFSNSVAIVFDFHDNIDQMGVWTNGQVPPGGNIAATRVNDGTVLDPNGSFDLRLASNGGLDLDNNRRFRIEVSYDENGFDPGTPENPADDTGLLTVQMRDAGNNAVLNTSKWNIDLETTLGDATTVMGWTAANGGLNERYEVYNFNYDGVGVPPGAPVTEVYARGSTWTPAFKTLLETRDLGDDIYGYQLYDAALPTPQNVNDIMPWSNMDELVVRFGSAPSGSGIPATGMILDGVRQDYTVTAVTALDAQTYVLRLNTVLGGNPATAATNGDRVKLDIPGGGAAGAPFSMRFNFVQGDVNKSGSVLANDYSEVKARFFQNTTNPAYSPFHDVDGSGSVLANDYSTVKARFFHNLPAAPAGASLFSSDRVAEEVLG